LFDEFVTGQYSLKTLAAKCKAAGWTIRGRRVATSTLHRILRIGPMIWLLFTICARASSSRRLAPGRGEPCRILRTWAAGDRPEAPPGGNVFKDATSNSGAFAYNKRRQS
jgi:hypothetical protein